MAANHNDTLPDRINEFSFMLVRAICGLTCLFYSSIIHADTNGGFMYQPI
jgi:hypothetical protein